MDDLESGRPRLRGGSVTGDRVPPEAATVAPVDFDGSSSRHPTCRTQWPVPCWWWEGVPRLARVIEHQGESFAWLKSLGFNAVRLAAPPSAEQLREARESDLWLMAPPSRQAVARDAVRLAERVLAWDLGDQSPSRSPRSTRAVARQLRSLPEAESPTADLPPAGGDLAIQPHRGSGCCSNRPVPTVPSR